MGRLLPEFADDDEERELYEQLNLELENSLKFEQTKYSVCVTKWKDYFPQMELMLAPSFQSRIITCASMEVLQAYLVWRQNNCHVQNQYNTCLWMLIKSGKNEKEAEKVFTLKGTGNGKQEKNELLFKQLGIDYKKLPPMFRQGSCILRRVKRLATEVEDVVVYSGNIASRSFWSEHPFLMTELGGFEEDINKVKHEYLKSFVFEHKLMASTWIVVRIDGRHFHGFSEVHEFEKPNDGQALNLMNSCAVAVIEEFQDVVFSYGLCFEEGFPVPRTACQKELKKPPSFDGRAVCYPSTEILRDYLAWRQVVGTRAQDKNELLSLQFGIDYHDWYAIHVLTTRHYQSCSVRDPLFSGTRKIRLRYTMMNVREKCRKKVVVEHSNIIEQSFRKAHPSILDEKH